MIVHGHPIQTGEIHSQNRNLKEDNSIIKKVWILRKSLNSSFSLWGHKVLRLLSWTLIIKNWAQDCRDMVADKIREHNPLV